MQERSVRLERKQWLKNRLQTLFDAAPELEARFKAVRSFGSEVRISEYHLTNACNIRCKGCWFFEFGHDKSAKEAKTLEEWQAFIAAQRRQRINSALLIGGEPTMFQERIAAFVDGMKNVTISTNGLLALPQEEKFARVSVMISLFGGGPLDDELRAIKPSGRSFTGLFEQALQNYRDDPRANFVFAVTERSVPYIEDTVRRIAENGNQVTINFYSQYNAAHPLRIENQQRLLQEVLRVKALYPQVVVSHQQHILGVITGRAWCGEFSGATCPSISQSHPANAERIANGHPYLHFFNTWKADLQTLEVCCTSGHCDDCRDSQAVFSWQMVNLEASLNSVADLRTWIEVAESYWSQFVWTPYHRSQLAARESAAALAAAAAPHAALSV